MSVGALPRRVHGDGAGTRDPGSEDRVVDLGRVGEAMGRGPADDRPADRQEAGLKSVDSVVVRVRRGHDLEQVAVEVPGRPGAHHVRRLPLLLRAVQDSGEAVLLDVSAEAGDHQGDVSLAAQLGQPGHGRVTDARDQDLRALLDQAGRGREDLTLRRVDGAQGRVERRIATQAEGESREQMIARRFVAEAARQQDADHGGAGVDIDVGARKRHVVLHDPAAVWGEVGGAWPLDHAR